jgi:hypothetical protein
MDRRYTLVIPTLLLLLITTPTFAECRGGYDSCGQPIERNIERRIARQHSCIEHGIDTGKLIPKEAEKLKKKLRKIRQLNSKYQQDRHLSNKEFLRLIRKLNRNSELIWEYRHNDRVRDRYS